MGTTGPQDIDPATGEPWALSFPVITIRDMVRAQKLLLDHLGIEQPVLRDRRLDGRDAGAANGRPSYPDSVFAAVPIAGAARHSAQNIAFHEVGRQAIMADPDWCGGRYLSLGRKPVARARRGPHGGAHHLSVRSGIAPQIRPQPAGPPRRHLRFRRRFPGRELSAPPGQHLCRPLRRQLLSLHHPRDGLFRPGGGARRVAGRRVRGHALALLHHLIHQRLAVSDPGKPGRSCMR